MTNKLIKSAITILIAVLLVGTSGCGVHRHSVRKDRSGPISNIEKDKEIGEAIEESLEGIEKLIVEEAFEWIGTKYEYGRQDKGVATDCSGMVMRVYEAAIGCQLPRNSAKQAEFCKQIKKSHIKPGDLVFFITNNGDKINHVGIMIDGLRFIHASTKGVMVSSMETEYYKSHFQKYGRVPCAKH